MIELTINRSIWHRGKEAAEKDAYVYNSDTGKMDIIGILLRAVGVSNKLMDKTRLPSSAAHLFLPNKRRFEPPLNWLVTASHADTTDTIELIRINDDPSYKEEEREEKITSFLSARGISVKFKDGDATMPEPEIARRTTSSWDTLTRAAAGSRFASDDDDL